MISVFSCSEIGEYSESTFIDFGEKGMIPKYEYLFYPFEKISEENKNSISKSEEFKMFLEVRYSDQCIISQLPLNMEYSSVNQDSIFNKKLNIGLFDVEDNGLGKGNFSIRTTKIPLFDSLKIDKDLFVAFSTDATQTEGILSIGITIIPIDN